MVGGLVGVADGLEVGFADALALVFADGVMDDFFVLAVVEEIHEVAIGDWGFDHDGRVACGHDVHGEDVVDFAGGGEGAVAFAADEQGVVASAQAFDFVAD